MITHVHRIGHAGRSRTVNDRRPHISSRSSVESGRHRKRVPPVVLQRQRSVDRIAEASRPPERAPCQIHPRRYRRPRRPRTATVPATKSPCSGSRPCARAQARGVNGLGDRSSVVAASASFGRQRQAGRAILVVQAQLRARMMGREVRIPIPRHDVVKVSSNAPATSPWFMPQVEAVRRSIPRLTRMAVAVSYSRARRRSAP